MGNALLAALSFIISVVFNIYALLLGVRFIMQLFRADYYNPLAQFVVKVTDPVLKPVRRFVPSIKTYDTSSLMIIQAILSWFPNPSTDSIRNLLSGITEPILRPIRKHVPPIGGLDLSILIGIVALIALRMVVTGTLMSPFLPG